MKYSTIKYYLKIKIMMNYTDSLNCWGTMVGLMLIEDIIYQLLNI